MTVIPAKSQALVGNSAARAAADLRASAEKVKVPLLQPEDTIVGVPTTQRFS
jgi:hypothetical protein